MAQIKINNLSFQYDNHGDDIFKNVSINIDTDWKLGLIGRNGRGKTTFLKLLKGEYKYSGQIISPVSFDYFPMNVENDNQVALEVMREAIAPFTKWEKELKEYSSDIKYIKEYGEVLDKFISYDGYIINEMIEKEVRKIGLGPEILDRNFKTLSSGERTKLLLSALFLRKNNFLLIDEPTNHLDSEGRECVAKYLNKKKGFILVSHDRNFLDEVINHVLSINKSNIDIQKGNYTTWQVNNDRRDEFEKSENEKLLKNIKRLKIAAKQKSSWSDKLESTKIGGGPVDRGYIGHKASKMMKRAKCLEKRQNKAIEEKSKLLKNIEQVEKLKIGNIETNSDKLLEVVDLQIVYQKEIFKKPISFKIKPGDRIWIRGKNGCGKSSLIKLLMGEEINYTGYVEKVSKISYVSQETNFLKGKIEEFSAEKGINIQHLKSSLNQVGVTNIQFEKNIEQWSEGQKKKLLIAASLCEKSQLYIWDEPLNFIDVISRIQIENMILEEKPTMLFVEHDKCFGEKIATKIIDII
ncbi:MULTISPECIES: ribosomal protection-like ABC-F family protein [Romboutsia]|uniref:Nucleotide-binding protein ExpZ n=1 Tax=Romboutsia hominis TaxID=1507512 RepID=A0A2P2BRQ4_9FIRM|nr:MULTISPECIES: ABC-F type ribosomal protection protein [Romboutsia]MDB8805124.1 ABC-F type ribosomal protection protein [Romboutsia sp. 1001216sp1]MDB8808713.1 ABC-F type ribosomal protection protein [Romboutsia sp. 1001216sp1]MDB8810769.1 ABC-F type ribosomal protection protein [Romboutsia sp. 1001216sp1]MDB8816489.1 ABC-F type ribosomal protection protein [Romboutsia sp. 1001216sp1]MDB8820125.1 ABC-F type ribosomal protection protein [Romboutsia sp. 1001216sp1]